MRGFVQWYCDLCIFFFLSCVLRTLLIMRSDIDTCIAWRRPSVVLTWKCISWDPFWFLYHKKMSLIGSYVSQENFLHRISSKFCLSREDVCQGTAFTSWRCLTKVAWSVTTSFDTHRKQYLLQNPGWSHVVGRLSHDDLASESGIKHPTCPPKA